MHALYDVDDETFKISRKGLKQTFVLQPWVQQCTQLNKDSHVGARKFSVGLPLRRPQHAVSNIEKNAGRLLKLYKELQHVDQKDIEAGDLCSELQFTAKQVEKRALPQDSLKCICTRKYSS